MEIVHQIVRQRTGREMERQKKLYDSGKVADQHPSGTKEWERTDQRTKGKSPKLQINFDSKEIFGCYLFSSARRQEGAQSSTF